MRHRVLPALAVVLAAWSCGQEGAEPPVTAPAPSPSPTPTPRPTAAFAYVASRGGRSGGIAAYRMDLGTGAWAPVSSVPAASPQGLASDPAGRFLYAVDNTSASFPSRPYVVGYRIASTGALDEVGRAPVPVGWSKPAQLLAVSDRFAFALANDSSTAYAVAIVVYRIGPGGEPTMSGYAGAGVRCCLSFFAPDPAFRSVYMDSGGSDRVVAYLANADGTLARSGEAPAADNPWDGAVHSSGRWLLVTGGSEPSGYLATYALGGTGIGGPVASIDTGDTSPRRMALDPRGRFVYLIGQSYRSDFEGVLSYAIDADNGALRHVSSPLGVRSPQALAVDPSGRFLLVAGYYNEIRAFAIDQQSGALRDAGVVARPGFDATDIALVAVR